MRATVAGYPLAYHKTSGGAEVEWIGARLRVVDDYLRVEIPESKLTEARGSINLLLDGLVALRRDVWTLAGKPSYFAGVVPRLRASITPLWAVASGVGAGHKLPGAMAHAKAFPRPAPVD